MLSELDSLQTEALAALGVLHDEASLEAFRIDYLGKKGRLTALSARMREVPADQKKDVGAKLNEVREALTSGLDGRLGALQAAKDAASVAGIDLTLPGRPFSRGSLHPLTQIRDLAVRTLRRMGFALADGPEIETEWHCFDALNTPADHPARNESDTFYMPDGSRTTGNGQLIEELVRVAREVGREPATPAEIRAFWAAKRAERPNT